LPLTTRRSVLHGCLATAAWKIVATFRQQQRLYGLGHYSFGRLSITSSENPPLDGYGNPARPALLQQTL
jgi:hypothetical protein